MRTILENPQGILIEKFLEACIKHLEENPPRIQKCLDQISEEECWQKPNSQTNSIGNLLLHLCGNITQYIIAGLGGATDNRRRDDEFAASGGWSKSELLEKITGVTREAVSVVKGLSADQLVNGRSVQGFQLTGFGIVIHVVEHYSYHVGQIAQWTKLLSEKDLGFYADLDLNITS